MAEWTLEAQEILRQRYLKKDSSGKVIESEDEMLDRVATFIASNEKQSNKWKIKFLEIMDSLEFLPNSPTLANAGKLNGQLSGCISGDTIIRTCGGDYTIKELSEKYSPEEKFEVFSVEDGELQIGQAFNARKTKEKAKIYKIIFDDNSELKATEDHLILLRDGNYSKVEDLQIGQSVMSLNRIQKKKEEIHNHKIISIEFFGYEDVYDLSVDKYHNFAANNIFVHNCYVLPIEDSLAAIFEMVKQSALVHKSGGGTGFSFSKLRPKGSMVNSTFGVASGPCSFIHAFDAVTEVVKQGGMRRGANLGLLNISHPDIYEFINSKKDTSKLQNFNISVGLNGIFLDLVKNNKKHWLVNPVNKEDRKQVDAKDLFDLMCQNIWETGEPGMLFLDTINDKNPIPWMGRIEASNPCGEAVLLPYESCNLGSIDVSKFYKENDLDWNKLKRTVEISVRFLDNVIDKNKFPTIKVDRKTKRNRKIGLGVMGFADLLFMMKLKYNSDEALCFAEKLMKFINDTSHEYSRELGKEKGYFPSDNGRLKLRNACLTTIAPTGTLSLLANCSSSIEPIFAKKFTKTVLGNVKINLSDKYKPISKEKYFVSALDISPEYHIRMQSVFQAHCLSGDTIINTCNGDFPIKDLVGKEDIYVYSYNLGEIDIKKAKDIRMTQEMAPIYEVIFNNGNIIKCTSEHLIMRRDERYVRMKDLKIGDSVMPFNYFYSKNGYRMIYTKIDKNLRAAFKFIDEKFNGELSKGMCVHHKNWIKTDDSPENLLRLEINEHSIVHKDIAMKIGKLNKGKIRTTLQRKNISEAHKKPDSYEFRNCLYCGKEFYVLKKISKRCCSTSCAAYIREKSFRENNFNYSIRGNKKGWKPSSETIKRMTGRIPWNKNLTKFLHPSILSISKKMIGNKNGLKNKTNLYNHKIVSIKFAGYENVYNMEIEDTKNFAANGVIVHNCDNAVSKTINLPVDSTVDEIKNGIFLAYSLGVKGLTFYRYGTREAPIEISVEGLSECENGKCTI